MDDFLNTDEGWLPIPGFTRYSYHPERRIVRRDAVKDAQGRVLRKPCVMSPARSTAGAIAIRRGLRVRVKGCKKGPLSGSVRYNLVADGKQNGEAGYQVFRTENQIRRLLNFDALGTRTALRPIRHNATGIVYPSVVAACRALGLSQGTVCGAPKKPRADGSTRFSYVE